MDLPVMNMGTKTGAKSGYLAEAEPMRRLVTRRGRESWDGACDYPDPFEPS